MPIINIQIADEVNDLVEKYKKQFKLTKADTVLKMLKHYEETISNYKKMKEGTENKINKLEEELQVLKSGNIIKETKEENKENA